MSRIDRIEADLQKQMEETERWKREARIKDNTMKAKEKLSEMGLPSSMLDIMDVSSDEALAQSLEKATSIAEEIKQSTASSFASKYGQPAPKGGAADGVAIPKSYAEAKTKEEKIAFLKAKRE
jgi:hypothetical protein